MNIVDTKGKIADIKVMIDKLNIPDIMKLRLKSDIRQTESNYNKGLQAIEEMEHLIDEIKDTVKAIRNKNG